MWLLILALALPARAVDAEIEVYADDFARWDGTRWLVRTEVGTPIPVWFAAERNLEFASSHFQVRAVLACEKDWGRKRILQVDCVIEDIGIQAVAVPKDRRDVRREAVQSVLDEIDAKLTGADMQLQVSDDGRVTNIDLEGVPKGNRRLSAIHDTLRNVMSRTIVGYDMKLRRYTRLREGAWTEYNPRLMTLPFTGTAGSSTVVHVLQDFRGYPTVESRGRGMIMFRDNYFETELRSVSVYHEDDGFMLERVWALAGRPTASSPLAEAGGGDYLHLGRLRILPPDLQVDVGPTRQIAPPHAEVDGLAAWEPLDPPDEDAPSSDR